MSDQNQPNEAGMQAARRICSWELGDPSWARQIVLAYLNPEYAEATMDLEGVPKC